MFKKLKEKITEEVKSSPQRFQQLTQSVSDRLQNSATSDENFFSIGDDDANMSGNSLEPGFSSVSLVSPQQENRPRRTSTSSMASDVSFLPRYESVANMYHLQSDLDISASEIEDNASSSSQLGHLTKDQIYSAFQKSQMRYHKYRGRYTDLARHYKEVEREIVKMKSVLVETQDKAIRRVTELKEQSALEQKAKAHLEAALRDELDEKQFKIQALETKIDLLLNNDNKIVESENLENLTKYLNDARHEIENLNGKLQELKANSIVFQAKELDYKNKIAGLEKEVFAFSERERENNLILAQNKMELHNEILSKDAELSSLKQDNEVLRQSLDAYETKSGNNKLDNLQAQNKNLIEKLEGLAKKCKQYESDLMKLEQFKIQVKESEDKLETVREETKRSLLDLETKIDDKYKKQYDLTEVELNKEFKLKLEQISSDSNNFQQLQTNIIKRDEKIEELQSDLTRTESELNFKTKKYSELEQNYLELIDDTSGLKNTIEGLENELTFMQNENSQLQTKVTQLQTFDDERKLLEQKLDSLNNEYLTLQQVSSDDKLKLEQLRVRLEEKIETDSLELRNTISVLQTEKSHLQAKVTELETCDNERKLLQQQLDSINGEFQALENEFTESCADKIKLEQLRNSLEERIRLFEEKDEAIDLENTESKLLEMKLQKLEEENKNLLETFEKERKILNDLIEDNSKINELENRYHSLNIEYTSLDNRYKALETEFTESCEQKLTLERQNVEFEEKIRIFEEKFEVVELDKNESKLLELKLQKLEQDHNNVLESFENERRVFDADNSKLQLENNKFVAEMVELKATIEMQTLETSEIRENLLKEKEAVVEQVQKAFEEVNNLIEERREIVARILDLNNTNHTQKDDKNCKNLDEKIKQFQNKLSNEKSDFDKVVAYLKQLEDEKETLKQQIRNLHVHESKCEILENEKQDYEKQIVELRTQIQDINAEKNLLKNSAHNSQESLQQLTHLRDENSSLKNNLDKLSESFIQIEERNSQISSDNKYLTDENQGLIQETEELRVTCDNFKKQVDELSQLERHFNELVNEKQLLKDEIQELKISPLNNNELDEFKLETEVLRDKLTQYKSLDLTNKSSIEFYENELQKLKNQNEKLARKLDETLVTLNHCAELSGSTEIEYLRNVLYNYMLGKESLVLARVIAAVCKFDQQQTETVLAKEQQKQTLLGHLGIL